MFDNEYQEQKMSGYKVNRIPNTNSLTLFDIYSHAYPSISPSRS